MRFVESVLAAYLDVLVIPATFGTKLRPLILCLFNGIVLSSVRKICLGSLGYITLASIAGIAQYVAIQMGGVSLEPYAWKHNVDDIIKALETVRDIRFFRLLFCKGHLVSHFSSGRFPQTCCRCRLSGLVLLDSKDNIEYFCINGGS